MKNKTLKRVTKICKKSPLEVLSLITAFVLMAYFGMPADVFAKVQENQVDATRTTKLQIEAMQNTYESFGVLPVAEAAEATPWTKMHVTAYNSVPGQTDDTPCIPADGSDICELYKQGETICAANFVPLGTILHIEGIGDCKVRDRMNARYTHRVDLYMGMDIDGAKQFGVQYLTISTYPSK